MISNRIFSRALAFAVVLMLALTAGPAIAASIVDAKGRTVEVASTARILSLGPDVTEIIYALGAGDQIIAVDRSSRYPVDADSKANVGYRRTLATEGLVSLMPDVILASEDIGPPEVVEQLMQLSIPIVFIAEDNSGEGIARKIKLIAEVLDMPDAGTTLSAQVMADFEAATALTAAIPADKRKKVMFFHGLERLTGAGADTAAGAIIGYAGGINPLDIYDGYKQVSEESLLQLQPDVIMMMPNSRGGPTADEVFSVPALAATPAGRNRALIVIDGPYMLGFGPRTAEAVRSFAKQLYPELAGQ